MIVYNIILMIQYLIKTGCFWHDKIRSQYLNYKPSRWKNTVTHRINEDKHLGLVSVIHCLDLICPFLFNFCLKHISNKSHLCSVSPVCIHRVFFCENVTLHICVLLTLCRSCCIILSAILLYTQITLAWFCSCIRILVDSISV